MPVVQLKSAAKPSTFGYTPNIEEKKKEDKEKVRLLLALTSYSCYLFFISYFYFS